MVKRPRLKRTDRYTRFSGAPMAFSTWEGAPLEQADPVDTAISGTRAMRAVAVISSKARFSLPGSLRSSPPFTRTRRSFCSALRSLSRSARIRSASSSCYRDKSRRASANPAIPGVFKVPLRRPRCCIPPGILPFRGTDCLT